MGDITIAGSLFCADERALAPRTTESHRAKISARIPHDLTTAEGDK